MLKWSQNSRNPDKNPSPNLQKAFPNPPQTLPNRREPKVPPRKQQKLQQNCSPSMMGTLLGHILDVQGLPREAQEAPRTFQNGAKNAKKSMLKKQIDFRFDFFMVWAWFFMFFWTIFWSKKLPKLPKNIFAKTWKIVIFHKEKWYFQGFEGLKLKWASFTK